MRSLYGIFNLFQVLTHFFVPLAYRIEYLPIVKLHFRTLTARQRSIVLDSVDEQLTYEPIVITRNRFLMRPDSIADWELRIGELRVYYDIEEDPEQVVYICAVGVKEGNLVRIGTEVVSP
jgi:mRNA-degrading endonuclease RelE of RelBE toxin-antitoxin system